VEYIRIYGFYRWILPVEYRVRPLSTYGGVTGTGEFCHLQSLVDCKYTLKVYERAAAEAAPAERFIQSKGHYFFFLAPGERNLPRSFRLPRSSPPSPCPAFGAPGMGGGGGRTPGAGGGLGGAGAAGIASACSGLSASVTARQVSR